ncbi:hypothetical protein [Nonomuraea sp. 3N208]|uniref:hypothetical protein n=1 Tax=Nonomuraea sp. 3N208 TaxID=3457421 RepID=UPI003FCF54FD
MHGPVQFTDRARAVELLIERIADPATPHRDLLLAPPISLRGTTAPARPRDSLLS